MELKYPPIYDEEHDVTIYRVPMSTNEFIVPNVDDGGHSVYIRDDIPDEMALKACEHALEHIEKQDFQKQSVQEIENERHGLPVPVLVEVKKPKKRKKYHKPK